MGLCRGDGCFSYLIYNSVTGVPFSFFRKFYARTKLLIIRVFLPFKKTYPYQVK